MTWIQTASGKAVELLTPEPDTIDFLDIAHALSLICRFTGHTKKHYSVAQHSVLVAGLLPESMQLYGLLHDAHEAYIGDISTPMKWSIGAAAKERLAVMAADFDSAIWSAADLLPPSDAIQLAIKAADIQMLMTERRDLLGAAPRPWGEFESVMPALAHIDTWSAQAAKNMFLFEYDRLQRQRRSRQAFVNH